CFSLFLESIESEQGTQADANEAAEEGHHEPHPAMQAAGSDAAEERADIAAERHAGAIAHQQPADDRREVGSERDVGLLRELAGKRGCEGGPENDAEVHHRGYVE